MIITVYFQWLVLLLFLLIDSSSQRELNCCSLHCPERTHGEYLQACLVRCGREQPEMGLCGFYGAWKESTKAPLTESPVLFLEGSCTPWCKK